MADEKVVLSIKEVDGNGDQSTTNISYVNPEATDKQLHAFAEETIALSDDTLVSASRVETRDLVIGQDAPLMIMSGITGGSGSSDDGYVSELRIKWSAFSSSGYVQPINFRLPGVVAPNGYRNFTPLQIYYKLPTPFAVNFVYDEDPVCMAQAYVTIYSMLVGMGDFVDPARTITVVNTGTYEIEFYIPDNANYAFQPCKLIIEP